MEHEEFFYKYGSFVVQIGPLGGGISVEELYQFFKARLAAEEQEDAEQEELDEHPPYVTVLAIGPPTEYVAVLLQWDLELGKYRQTHTCVPKPSRHAARADAKELAEEYEVICRA